MAESAVSNIATANAPVSIAQSVANNEKKEEIEIEDSANSEHKSAGEATPKEILKPGRKRKSPVWNYFKEVVIKGEKKVQCIYCRKAYKASDTGATTTLKRHLKDCPYMKIASGNTKGMITFPKVEKPEEVNLTFMPGYDPMKAREIIAYMILAHELPYSIVDYSWFTTYSQYLCPIYQKVSRNTIKADCLKVYEAENEKLKKIFKKVDLISLTSDCWTSNQTISYMCVTAHYIDEEWQMQKRIISFNELSPPHTGETISDAIMECLKKWGIENKIGTITLDNASNNDRAAGLLRLSFEARGKLHFQGFFFHVRCCAHILNLVVQDGLDQIENCLFKVREGMKYLKKATARLIKFGEVATQSGITTRRSLCTDVKTRWNSTHRMLESVIHYKKAFEGYALRDSNFGWLLNDIEWANAKKVCKLLEVFSVATNLFSGTLYPTSNLFLMEIFKVKKMICEAYLSSDCFTSDMSVPMFEKFEKYWGEVSILAAMASILDPRFKKMSVELCFERLYPISEFKEHVENVIAKLRALFKMYAMANVAAGSFTNTAASSSNVAASSSRTAANSSVDDDFMCFVQSKCSYDPPRSDLDMYLQEPVFTSNRNEHFDVLSWWKVNSVKYPVLSKLARDVLSIPITTVASESAFSAGGRVLDDYRSSLSKDNVEVLVCGGDWVRANSKYQPITVKEATKDEEDLQFEIPMGTTNKN
ncbi:Zinc finger BED domain-containing protein DAYSLEEPER [Rhynchospora pubera]|uniref:Zinc finger BED domain-containing protein DAYSLEEPER n=1 Tax=Rhynchospora pubera TaxID=906938 RepID=A0AAV8FDP9_9POAL|nr:Zinc finger BED domain-containing protein DAYSLEEPER [Rhynchospora pubera]